MYNDDDIMAAWNYIRFYWSYALMRDSNFVMSISFLSGGHLRAFSNDLFLWVSQSLKIFMMVVLKSLISCFFAPKIALFLSHFSLPLKLEQKESASAILSARNDFTDNVRAFNCHCRHFMLIKGLWKRDEKKDSSTAAVFHSKERFCRLKCNAMSEVFVFDNDDDYSMLSSCTLPWYFF